MARTVLALASLIWLDSVGVPTSHDAVATEFHVSPAGSDSASGTLAAPWRTLQHAASSVGPGDRIRVQAGNYVGFHLTTSGLPGSPIEFLAAPGVSIVQRNAVTPDGINLEGASHVVLDGFQVAGMPRAGIRAVGSDTDFARGITVRNVLATANGKWGIFTGFVDDLVIENNQTSGSLDEHGIYVSNSGDRPVIRSNVVWGNRGNGIHLNGDESQGADGIISQALISGNVIYDNGLGGGSGINLDGVQNSRIENNLLYHNHASGISLYQIDGAAGSAGNLVVNNTVHQAANGRWALNIQDASPNNKLLNNIFLSEHAFRGALDISPASLAGLVSDYNLVISRFTTDGADSILSLAQWQALTGQDAHSLVAEPADLFVDWALGDYRLLPTAAARDTGTPQDAPLADLRGQPRPWGSGFDRGAYEYATILGDFDSDGDVDGADFLVWQRDPALGNLAHWQAQFGQGAGAASVPEPDAWVFFISLSLLVSLYYRATSPSNGNSTN